MNSIDIELIRQKLEGTDSLSIARGLAYAALMTWSHATNDLSETLLRGETDANGLIAVMKDCIAFAQNNAAVLMKQLDNFDALCAEVRKEN